MPAVQPQPMTGPGRGEARWKEGERSCGGQGNCKRLWRGGGDHRGPQSASVKCSRTEKSLRKT